MKFIRWYGVILVLCCLFIAVVSLWQHEPWQAFIYVVIAANTMWLDFNDWWRRP